MSKPLEPIARAVLILSVGFVVVATLALYIATEQRQATAELKRLADRAVKQDAETREANARLSKQRSEQLAALEGNTNLLKDCVGLLPGGECLRRLQALRMEAEQRERRELIAALVPAVVEALERKFGILQGQLRITVVQEPGKPPVVTVGGQVPGQEPTRQAPLPPGATVQDCVVELHAEPIVGACVVPR